MNCGGIKCVVYSDIILQVILFTSHFGLLMWNNLQEDHLRFKYFSDFTEMPLYIGIASSCVSLELDVFLLLFLEWNHDKALYWWNFVCLGVAILSWTAYLIVAISIRKLSLGLWAFSYLYTKAVLVMTVKADEGDTLGTKHEDDSNVKPEKKLDARKRLSKSSLSPVQTCRTTPLAPGNKSVSPRTAFGRSALEFENMSKDEQFARELLTFCTFLGTPKHPAPDHSMARDEPVIKVDEESFVEEIQTKL